jgi:hypothetical protein
MKVKLSTHMVGFSGKEVFRFLYCGHSHSLQAGLAGCAAGPKIAQSDLP